MTFLADKAKVICPTCKQDMKYNQQDNFYQCPQCKSQFWAPDNTLPCPGCSRPMRYKSPGYHQCPGCGAEFWPPEEEGGEEEEPEPRYYGGWGLVYLAEINRGKKGSKSSSGKRHKKKKGMSQLISQRYLL